MTETNFTQVGDHFYTGTATPPPITGDESDGDEYWVTSDGTVAGSVSEVWKFEEDSSSWVQQPLGAGTICPAPMTRTALLSLRNAGSLSKDCHYVITDYSRGTVGAASILLHAVDASTLGQGVQVQTAHDNTAWHGRYDIDTNRMLELSDNIGNVVSGQEVVDTFPWGVAAVSDNKIMEAASLVYVQGSFSDNEVRTGANVRIEGASGNMAGNVIGERANVTWSGGDFRENIVHSDATVTAGTTGDVDNNTFGHLSVVNITGGNIDANTIGNNSNLTVSGGSVSDNIVDADSTLVVVGGSVYENEITVSSTVRQTVARNFYENSVTRRSSVTQGNHNIFNSEFALTTVNTTGSTGSGIRYCKFLDGTGFSGMQNIATLDIAYCTFSNNSQISATNSSRLYLRYVTLENYGRILLSAGRLLDMNYTGLRDYSYVQVQGGRLYVNYSSVSGVSYVNQAGTVTGTNRVDRVRIGESSRVRFLGTCNNCRVYYSQINSGSYIEHRGSSTGCFYYYCEVSSASSMYSNNSVNLRAYYNTVSGNSQFYSQNVTGTHYVYYCHMAGHGYIRFYNASGGRLYAVSCHGQGLLNFYGSTGAGRLYYSSFTAYYYLNAANWTVTRHSLHGYGRQSYTVTNPPTNGTATRNF